MLVLIVAYLAHIPFAWRNQRWVAARPEQWDARPSERRAERRADRAVSGGRRRRRPSVSRSHAGSGCAGPAHVPERPDRFPLEPPPDRAPLPDGALRGDEEPPAMSVPQLTPDRARQPVGRRRPPRHRPRASGGTGRVVAAGNGTRCRSSGPGAPPRWPGPPDFIATAPSCSTTSPSPTPGSGGLGGGCCSRSPCRGGAGRRCPDRCWRAVGRSSDTATGAAGQGAVGG